MTPEELDEARAKEAYRQWQEKGCQGDDTILLIAIAARLAREGWTPPEPVVDPDLLAWREWGVKSADANGWVSAAYTYKESLADNTPCARAYLAGARMAREQERERAKPLVEYVEDHAHRPDGVGRQAMKSEILAREALAKYRGEA